jgi:hypothetical protein
MFSRNLIWLVHLRHICKMWLNCDTNILLTVEQNRATYTEYPHYSNKNYIKLLLYKKNYISLLFTCQLKILYYQGMHCV